MMTCDDNGVHQSYDELNAALDDAMMREPDRVDGLRYGGWRFDWYQSGDANLIMAEVVIDRDGSYEYTECWQDRTISRRNVDIAYIVNNLTILGLKK